MTNTSIETTGDCNSAEDANNLLRTSVILPMLLAGALSLAGCASCLDENWFTAQVAKYGVAPGPHKAMYVNLNLDNPDISIGTSSAQDTVAGAEAMARASCESDRRQTGDIHGECVPYAVDNQLTGYDISNDFCGARSAQFQERMASLVGAVNAVADQNQARASAIALSQQASAIAQQQAQAVKTRSAQTAALEQQIAALKSQMQRIEQQQSNFGSAPTRNGSGTSANSSAVAVPSTVSPAPRPLSSHFTAAARYVPDANGDGGLTYKVYVNNDGQVALRCTADVSGLIWGNQFGGAIGTGGGLQSQYSDTGTAVVYPGRNEVVAGFGSIVANSGTYTVQCIPYQ